MVKSELIELLEQVAVVDLVDGAELKHHPCSVAIKAIEQCFDDVNFLKKIIAGTANPKSKKAVMLLGLSYSPSW
ncbi:hypothetical protein KAR91_52755 [Candidatus Pacearchaeota archaeon]|nr:hypothetical protein [Candidatus Pacearchaeota archaeon]